MYFEDLTDYSYANSLDWIIDNKLKYINVGWLSSDYEFKRGNIDESIMNFIKNECYNNRVNLTAGFHTCDLCYAKNVYIYEILGIKFEHGLLNEEQNRIVNTVDWLNLGVGNGEIHLEFEDVIYISPQLIIHYIEKHNYIPPDEYLEAIYIKMNSISHRV